MLIMPAIALTSAAADVPRVPNHELEIVIVVDRVTEQ